MLYLEDYLEMIEHLPNELRDRFTEMREIDLGVENTIDSLEARQKTFFAGANKMGESEREETYQKIRKDYKKVVEEASEKIHIAEECYGLVDRYLRKLDQELHKFQLELEADNRGITEILEKRSLELDMPSTRPSSMKENRVPRRLKHTTIAHGLTERPSIVGPRSDRKDELGGSGSSSSGGPCPLQQMGSSGTAIAAAASQAIAATQLVPGRRSSSLKASYEAINLGVARHEFSLGSDLAGAAASALAATAPESQPPPLKKQKMKSVKSGGLAALGGPLDVVGGSLLEEIDPPGLVVDPGHVTPAIGPSPLPSPAALAPDSTPGTGSDHEWNYDPNEPRYCICNQVSYGDMVACDNEDCPYEWFHYPCVGITAPPKGKWYCQPCLANMRRRGRK